jgi:hypothetical protein
VGKKVVDSKWRKRSLVRYAIALTDIHLATQTCELLLEERPGLADPKYWAYHTAIVNAYARPFTENKPLGQLPESVVRILTSEERALHKELLDDRRTASAHSDLSAKPVYFVARGAELGETGERAETSGFVIAREAWEFSRWEEVLALTKRVGEHIQGEAFGLVEELYGDLYAPKPIEIEIE